MLTASRRILVVGDVPEVGDLATSGDLEVVRLDDDSLTEAILADQGQRCCVVLGAPDLVAHVVQINARQPDWSVVGVFDSDELDALDTGLEAGLDDYIVRLDDREQTARLLRIVLRRLTSRPLHVVSTRPGGGHPTDMDRDRLTFAELDFWDVFDAAPVGLKILDPSNRILYANRQLQRTLGRSEAQLHHARERELIHPDDHQRDAADFRAITDGERDFTALRVRHIRSDGAPVWTELSRMALRTPTGELVWVVETITDISEHVELEAQLRDGERMRALGELSGGIAHDFNNLLAVVDGHARLLEATLPDGAASPEHVEAILAAVERGRVLTSELTAFSRRTATTGRVDLDVAVDEMVQLMSVLLGSRIELEVEHHHTPLPIHAERVEIDRILLNLITNARDAVAEHGRLSIETCRASAVDADGLADAAGQGPYGLLRVSDDGSGIEPDKVHRIFERYFTTKDGRGHGGLGLSMVYGIVQGRNGLVRVDSTVGEGTTLEIYLPLSEPESAQK